MKVVDMHCDTIGALYEAEQRGEPVSLLENGLHLDLKKMEKGDYFLQNFALFVDLGHTDEPFKTCVSMADLFYREMEKNRDRIAPVTTWKEMEENWRQGKMSALLTLEEGEVCEGNPAFLRTLYRLGARMMTLTWNYENCIGYPNIIPKYRQKGLKPFGLDVVSRMEELGMIIDVSHLSDGGFEDVFSHSKRPFIASHSNAREILNHPRNLTDEMIRKIAEKGGVIGLNFGGEFLQKTGRSTVEAMLPHIRHIQNVGGHEVLAIGTDFDGVEEDMEIQGCQDMPYLIQALERHGLSASEIGGICYENAEKFLKRYWEN